MKSTKTHSPRKDISMDNHTRKLLGLTDENLFFETDWLEERRINGRTITVIKGKLTYSPVACTKCGIKNEGQIIKNGTHTTRTQLLPFRERKTILELKRSRFLCKECGATFNAHTSLVEENCQISKELRYKIAFDLKKNISRKQIAQDNFVSDVTVLRVMNDCVKTFKPNFKYLPSVLCIDEFRSMKSCKGSMSFICLNGHTNKIISVLENRQLAYLKTHFLRYPRKVRCKVKYLVMDMNAPYAQLIKAIFPKAQIVTDRFHIVQQINRAFNQLRVKTMNGFRKKDETKYRRLKRFWKLLLKNSFHLNSTSYPYNRSFKRPMTEKAIIDELLSYDETLKLAYETCQLLLYHYRTKNTLFFFELIQELDRRLPKEFRKKLTFFKKYKQGIQNAFELTYSNGAVEGTNNKIKVIKRVAYGYRNFLNFRARIYIIQGLIFN